MEAVLVRKGRGGREHLNSVTGSAGRINNPSIGSSIVFLIRYLLGGIERRVRMEVRSLCHD